MSQVVRASSNMVAPYREIGRISEGDKFVINKLGDRLSIVVSIGRVFHVYSFDKLRVILVSEPFPDPIDDFFCFKNNTVIISGHSIHVYVRNRYK